MHPSANEQFALGLNKRDGELALIFSMLLTRPATAVGKEPSITVFPWPVRLNTLRANARLAFPRSSNTNRKHLFTHAAGKATALHAQSAIMRVLFEVASYDFRP